MVYEVTLSICPVSFCWILTITCALLIRDWRLAGLLRNAMHVSSASLLNVRDGVMFFFQLHGLCFGRRLTL